jgi:hypothetical protein
VLIFEDIVKQMPHVEFGPDRRILIFIGYFLEGPLFVPVLLVLPSLRVILLFFNFLLELLSFQIECFVLSILNLIGLVYDAFQHFTVSSLLGSFGHVLSF